MSSYDWAKDKLIERQRAQQENRRFEALDKNELGKFVSTLRHCYQTGLLNVARALPNSRFAQRSRKYPRKFQDLNKLVGTLPTGDVELFRTLRWLCRLLEIEDKNPPLLRWLLQGEQVVASTQSLPSSQLSIQPDQTLRPAQGEHSKAKRRKKKRGKK